jgi:hypothetical protein
LPHHVQAQKLAAVAVNECVRHLVRTPYEADVADGNKNWQYNLMLGVGYHFHWGDVSLAARNLTYIVSDKPILAKVRMTGPVLSATFRR